MGVAKLKVWVESQWLILARTLTQAHVYIVDQKQMSDVYNDLFAPRLVRRKNLCNTEQVVLEVYDFVPK